MPKKILVVDDKENIREMLRDYLTEENFLVSVAENGEQALQMARESRSDLILLDIMMPRMDGYQFLQECKRAAPR